MAGRHQQENPSRPPGRGDIHRYSLDSTIRRHRRILRRRHARRSLRRQRRDRRRCGSHRKRCRCHDLIGPATRCRNRSNSTRRHPQWGIRCTGIDYRRSDRCADGEVVMRKFSANSNVNFPTPRSNHGSQPLRHHPEQRPGGDRVGLHRAACIMRHAIADARRQSREGDKS